LIYAKIVMKLGDLTVHSNNSKYAGMKRGFSQCTYGYTLVHVSQNVGSGTEMYTATTVNMLMKRGFSQCTFGYTLVQVSQNLDPDSGLDLYLVFLCHCPSRCQQKTILG
jgi:hypothetical protein